MYAATPSVVVPDSPDYDIESLDQTRDALLNLAAGLSEFGRMFGSSEQVDPIRHLIGTAAGWGGLPTTEAAYVGAEPNAGRETTS